MVFNWFAALAVKLNEETLSKLLSTILAPIVRELSTDDEQGTTIRRVAKEVLKFYREKIPRNVYDDVIAKVQRALDIKRAKRKANLAHMVSITSCCSCIYTCLFVICILRILFFILMQNYFENFSL